MEIFPNQLKGSGIHNKSILTCF